MSRTVKTKNYKVHQTDKEIDPNIKKILLPSLEVLLPVGD